MSIILVCAVGLAFVVGLCVGYAKGHESRECLRRACRKLVESNSELRSELVTNLYRPMSDVEPVPPEIERRVLAEHFSAYDPRYDEETG